MGISFAQRCCLKASPPSQEKRQPDHRSDRPSDPQQPLTAPKRSGSSPRFGSKLGNVAAALGKLNDARSVAGHLTQDGSGIAEYAGEWTRCSANGKTGEFEARRINIAEVMRR
jgi:hypothetical protein